MSARDEQQLHRQQPAFRPNPRFNRTPRHPRCYLKVLNYHQLGTIYCPSDFELSSAFPPRNDDGTTNVAHCLSHGDGKPHISASFSSSSPAVIASTSTQCSSAPSLLVASLPLPHRATLRCKIPVEQLIILSHNPTLRVPGSLLAERQTPLLASRRGRNMTRRSDPWLSIRRYLCDRNFYRGVVGLFVKTLRNHAFGRLAPIEGLWRSWSTEGFTVRPMSTVTNPPPQSKPSTLPHS
ncbi:hypothetical protein NMY22_g15837 [Coprinellus aureogranulatus]|nr:hypothetical protein NMY22_g15837 [Coprinellus aureogranulatus]